MKLKWRKIWTEAANAMGLGAFSISSLVRDWDRTVARIVSRHIRDAGDGWIDVKKRKPPHLRHVLAQSGGVVIKAFYRKDTRSWWHSYAGVIDPVPDYWQPLPKPRAKARKR